MATGDQHTKFREDRSSISRDMLADRHTDRQTDRNTPLPCRGRVKGVYKQMHICGCSALNQKIILLLYIIITATTAAAAAATITLCVSKVLKCSIVLVLSVHVSIDLSVHAKTEKLLIRN